MKPYIAAIRLTCILLVLFSWFARPAPAYACSCVAGVTIDESFSMDNAVFTGKTLRIVDNYVPIFSTLDNVMYKLGLSPYFFHEGGKLFGYTIFFQATKSWKGMNRTIIPISTGRGGGDCGYEFELNREYIVYASYAYGVPDNYLVTSICSRTAPLSEAREDINFLSTLPVLPLKPVVPLLWTEKDLLFASPSLLICAILLFRWTRRQKSRSPKTS